MHADVLLHYAARAVGILLVVAQLGLIPLVLVRRKEASSTIAWILVLLFIPALGAFLFLLFGRDRVRMSAARKRKEKAASRERLRTFARSRRSGALLPVSSDPSPSDPTPSGPPSSTTRVDSGYEIALAFENAELEDRLALLDPIDRPVFRVGGRLGHMAATTGNVIGVTVAGEETIAAKFEAIEAAQRSVHAEYYLVRNDKTGARFRDLLVGACKRGVKVRLLVDGFGGLALDHDWIAPIERAGGHVARFLPISALGSGLQSRVLGAFQWNLRNHRKILVIDGRIAFTGGVNIGDDVGSWRDTHIKVEGPVVHSLQAIFLEDWEFATSKKISDADDFPSFPPKEPSLAEGGVPKTTHTRGIVEVVASGPDTANEAIHRVFFAAITQARQRVFITTPYFVPDRALIVALQTAALSGVDVKLIVPKKGNHPVTAAAGRSYYEEVLEAGVGIFEYLPGMIHAKTIVVDGRVALVGSANMDMRSFRLNYEVHTVIRDVAAAERLERSFHEDLGQTRRIELGEWKRRGVWARIGEGGGRLFAPLL
jgi:cardiolipin synthase